MPRTPAAASLSVAAESAAALRQLAFTLSAKLGRRVTLSDALAAAVRAASADLDATAFDLNAHTGEDTP